jgi:citrate lyase subunit beta / citryl-CoA lyase
VRLRRSELSTPAGSERMIAKAAASSADLVFLDLEDSIASTQKGSARRRAIDGLRELDWGGKTRAVRVNSIETEYAHQDIIELLEGAGAFLDLMIVPKVKSAHDVLWVDVLLSQLEARFHLAKRIGLEVLIEDVEAMINVDQIARSSPRLEALIFGPGDYSASQGMDSGMVGGPGGTYPGDIWHYARNRIVVAARAARLDAIDGPYAAFSDAEGYREEARRAAVLGFVGKWAIHPNQIELANDVFSPPADKVAAARRLLAEYEQAEARGEGAIAVDNVMVDVASARILRSLLQRADLIGM